MSPKEWLSELVKKLSGCKADILQVQAGAQAHQASHVNVALKDEVKAVEEKVSALLVQLQRLVEYHNALAKRVEALSAPAPQSLLPPAVVDQFAAINEAFANLPALPE